AFVAGQDACTLSLAYLPESTRCRDVLRLRARKARLHIDEVAAVGADDFGRGGKPHERFRALLNVARNWSHKQHSHIHQKAVVAVEPARDETGMKAMRRHVAALEAACEFAGEEDGGELGLLIAAETAIGALGVEV